jgi:hypothetical protein
VRPRDRDLLARHPNWLLGAEAFLQPRIRLDIQLVTHAIAGIDVCCCRYRAAVASVHRCEPLRDRHQGSSIERLKPAEFAEYTPQSLWLSTEIYDNNRPDSAIACAEGRDPAAWTNAGHGARDTEC